MVDRRTAGLSADEVRELRALWRLEDEAERQLHRLEVKSERIAHRHTEVRRRLVG